jgi:hypothetical protein
MSDKTTELRGWTTTDDGRRVELPEDEVRSILDAIEARDAAINAAYPDEKSALHAMADAFHRMRDFGWSEAVYCPKDGTPFEVIEAGSTGIHRCSYQGEWPNGSWWVEAHGDLWPSRPILFRLYPEDETKRKTKMTEAAARFAQEDADA